MKRLLPFVVLLSVASASVSIAAMPPHHPQLALASATLRGGQLVQPLLAQDTQPADVAPVVPVIAAPAGTLWAVFGSLLALVLPIAWKIYSDYAKDKATARLQFILGVARLVFYATEEAKRLWPDKVPDAAVWAESKFLEELQKLGTTASPSELTQAKLLWSSLHGENKVHDERAAAMAGAAPASP